MCLFFLISIVSDLFVFISGVACEGYKCRNCNKYHVFFVVYILSHFTFLCNGENVSRYEKRLLIRVKIRLNFIIVGITTEDIIMHSDTALCCVTAIV